MKLQYLLACSALILLIAAADPAGKATGKVKNFYSSRDKGTTFYTYNGNGLVSSIVTAEGEETDYSYSADIMTKSTKGNDPVTMYLNKQGLVDSLIMPDAGRPQSGIGPTGTLPYQGIYFVTFFGGANAKGKTISRKFTYDTNGYLQTETDYINGRAWSKATSTVEHGNVTSYLIHYLNLEIISLKISEKGDTDIRIKRISDWSMQLYYNEKPNSLQTDLHFGHCSANLLARDVIYEDRSGKDSTTHTYTYIIDKAGRINTLTKTVKSTDPPTPNSDALQSDKVSFTYY